MREPHALILREVEICFTSYAPTCPPILVGRPCDAAKLLQARIKHEAVEVCVLLLVSTKLELIAVHEVGRGTLDACLVHPRDVFKAALLANAASVIVGHNHPSGDPTPSRDDFALCARLRDAGELVGVPLADFIIVGRGSYYSFNEGGL
jgi:DNA repair protein RadC